MVYGRHAAGWTQPPVQAIRPCSATVKTIMPSHPYEAFIGSLAPVANGHVGSYPTPPGAMSQGEERERSERSEWNSEERIPAPINGRGPKPIQAATLRI